MSLNQLKVGISRNIAQGITDSQECRNDRETSSLSVVKIHWKGLVNRVVESTDMEKGEEQRDFREDRSCIDQINIVRQICERKKKYICSV